MITLGKYTLLEHVVIATWDVGPKDGDVIEVIALSDIERRVAVKLSNGRVLRMSFDLFNTIDLRKEPL